jgi:intein-encoded DNA endonuclease-like protein
LFETNIIYTTAHYIIWLSAQPIFTNDNRLTQYGEFGKNTDIDVYVYSIPKYTTLRWYRDNTQVSPLTKYVMSDPPAIVNDTFHGKDVQLDGYSVVLTIINVKESDFNVSYRLQLSYGASQAVQYTVLLKSASKYFK